MNIDLSALRERINSKYYPLLKCKDRFLVLYGSAGSGKSHFIAQKWLVRILVGMKTGKKHRFLALRKTQPAVKKSVFALIKKYIYAWGIDHLVKINSHEMTFTFVGGSEIICGGLDDPEKIKSIEGITGIWLEEATEFTVDDFRQLNLRVRGFTESYKQIILSFNPISKTSWVHKEFFKSPKDNATVVHSTYKDNRFLDDEYIKVLEDLEEEDPAYHRVYALGEWGELKGLIYGNWDVIDKFPDNVDEEIYSLDFGFNNPSCLLKIGIKDSKHVYIQELIYESKLTNGQLIEKTEDLVEEEKVDKEHLFKADSAEPDRIQEFSNAGFFITPCRKGKNSVKDGIDVVKRKKLHITKDSVNVIDEIQAYKWKEDKEGNTLDEPVKFKDHGMDAIRYGIGDMEDEAVVAITSDDDYNPFN